MARLNLLLVVISVLSLAGCSDYIRMNDSLYQFSPDQAQTIEQEPIYAADQMELELVEQLSASRNAYTKDLAALKNYYANTGSFRKYNWALNEEKKFQAIPKYTYIVPAEVASKELSATDSIESADKLFDEGLQLYRQGYVYPVVPNRTMMRKAIAKFNQLVDMYPTSDKIDDSAFMAAELYEEFGDWSLAATYYQRTFLWNPENEHPARFRAAEIFDKKLKKRDIALSLYTLSVEKEGERFLFNKRAAEKRIQQLNETTATAPQQQ
jgi:tetratricopeptide (TPR) repeat protein